MLLLCGFIAGIPAIGTAIQQAVVITSVIATLFTGCVGDWGFVIASSQKAFVVSGISGALHIRLGSDAGNDKYTVQNPVKAGD